MKTVLKQLNAVPGVVGSLVCGADGQLVANSFPPLFDEAVLGDAARVLTDGAAGLESVTGKVKTVDLRFADARVVMRPMAGAHLVLLCAAQTNLQLLNISAGVAVPKLERMVAELPPPAPVRREKAKAEKTAKPARSAAAPGEDPGFFHW